MNNTQERLDELEARIAYQDSTIEELNSMVVALSEQLQKQADQIRLGNLREKAILYEKKIYDGGTKPVEAGLKSEDAKFFGLWGQGNAVSQSEFGSDVQFASLAEAAAVALQDEQYVVVYSHDLSPYAASAYRASQTEALQLLDDILGENPELVKRLTVVAEREIE